MIVLDDTAIVALANGHARLTAWAVKSPLRIDDRLFIPVLCAVSAVEHTSHDVTGMIGSWPGVSVTGLDFLGLHIIETLVRTGLSSSAAHAVHTARSSITEGSPSSIIVTADKSRFVGTQCAVADVANL